MMFRDSTFSKLETSLHLLKIQTFIIVYNVAFTLATLCFISNN